MATGHNVTSAHISLFNVFRSGLSRFNNNFNSLSFISFNCDQTFLYFTKLLCFMDGYQNVIWWSLKNQSLFAAKATPEIWPLWTCEQVFAIAAIYKEVNWLRKTPLIAWGQDESGPRIDPCGTLHAERLIHCYNNSLILYTEIYSTSGQFIKFQ